MISLIGAPQGAEWVVIVAIALIGALCVLLPLGLVIWLIFRFTHPAPPTH